MILKVLNVGKSFNGLIVLEDVSFELETGTITSLFGENGSGKTTLFHIISGFLPPSRGKIYFKGESIYDKPATEIDKLGIGRTWQFPRVFKNLSVLDNLLLASKKHPGEHVLNYLVNPFKIWQEEKKRKEKAVRISYDVGLSDKLEEAAGRLSFGQQKLLSIGMLLINEAELLLLDEPFAGLNVIMVDAISKLLLQLKEEGKTILMIEHDRKKAKAISDKVLYLTKGIIREDVGVA